MSELSYGEKAVGLTFNPSNNSDVDLCKKYFSIIIDVMNDLRNRTHSQEVDELCTQAIVQAQTAQMWAVKAITWKE